MSPAVPAQVTRAPRRYSDDGVRRRARASAPARARRRGHAGATLTAVGYGSDGVDAPSGILRTTTLTTDVCVPVVEPASAVCWAYTGDEGSTCTGDAGGALLLADGTLAGIVGGGTKSSCQA